LLGGLNLPGCMVYTEWGIGGAKADVIPLNFQDDLGGFQWNM
jgi:hypothetical protein